MSRCGKFADYSRDTPITGKVPTSRPASRKRKAERSGLFDECVKYDDTLRRRRVVKHPVDAILTP